MYESPAGYLIHFTEQFNVNWEAAVVGYRDLTKFFLINICEVLGKHYSKALSLQDVTVVLQGKELAQD